MKGMGATETAPAGKAAPASHMPMPMTRVLLLGRPPGGAVRGVARRARRGRVPALPPPRAGARRAHRGARRRLALRRAPRRGGRGGTPRPGVLGRATRGGARSQDGHGVPRHAGRHVLQRRRAARRRRRPLARLPPRAKQGRAPWRRRCRRSRWP
uniref:Uncharacterized protein n=1 Tax=Zea mays TaxID=4577 RepID=A0A804RKW6_MAIZE